MGLANGWLMRGWRREALISGNSRSALPKNDEKRAKRKEKRGNAGLVCMDVWMYGLWRYPGLLYSTVSRFDREAGLDRLGGVWSLL